MKFELFCQILTQHNSGSERVKKQYPQYSQENNAEVFS